MSKHAIDSLPLDHPEITAIALDIMIAPARRANYSSVVLMLADAAAERISRQLAGHSDPHMEAEAPAPDGPA
jgi:hypothetical protein